MMYINCGGGMPNRAKNYREVSLCLLYNEDVTKWIVNKMKRLTKHAIQTESEKLLQYSVLPRAYTVVWERG